MTKQSKNIKTDQDFKWLKEVITPCVNLKTKPHKYYQSFSKSGQIYQLDDFVLINETDKLESLEICQIKSLFQEDNGCVKGQVEKYWFANEFSSCFVNLGKFFDETNEIVRYLDQSYKIIDLNNVVRKCCVIFGMEDESAYEVIDKENFNRNDYFLCRYQYKNSQLIPLISTKCDNINNEIEFTVKSNIDNQTPGNKTSSVGLFTPKKVNDIELVEMDVDDMEVPEQVKSVKKNLTNSFESSTSLSDNSACSYINYSIIQSDKKPLKLKLRVSKSFQSKNPIVILNKDTINEDNDLNTLRNMVSNMELNAKPKRTTKKNEIHASPRKLRRVSNYYGELSTESESESISASSVKRKSAKSNSKKQTRRKNISELHKNQSDKENSDLSEIDEKENNKKTIEMKNVDVVNDRKKSLRGIRKNYEELNDIIIIESPNSKNNPGYKDSCDEATELPNFNETKSIKKPNQISEGTADRRKSLRGKKINFSELLDPVFSTPSKKYDSEKNLQVTRRSTRLSQSVNNPSTPTNESCIKRKFDTPQINNITCSTPKKTPRMSITKMMKEGTLTPVLELRKQKIVKVNTPLGQARNHLHVSYIPSQMPCREKEYSDIYNFVEGKLLDQCGGCMYISGVPGTGKTATVTMVINNLQEQAKKKKITNFNFVTVNGMRLTEPRQCYVEILKQLNGKRVSWEQALSLLETKFATAKSSNKIIPTILLIDELDILCTKRQDVVYNLLNWPTKANAQLIVITIANTMDLPERLLLSRVTSRLGLTRLTFQPYTFKQLQEIVINRLTGNNSFSSDAIQFVARKVASISGDARRALDICRRSAEIAELEGVNTKVSMKHVNEAIEAMITQPKVMAIKHCSRLEKLLLQAVVAEVERTGVEETTFKYVYRMLTSIAAIEGFKMVSSTLVAAAIYKLGSCKLLLTDPKHADFNRKIILNVSSDDVYYALKSH